jgi:hypothetical protein
MSLLTRVDRLQFATPDAARAAEGWKTLLGAEHDHDDRVDALAALRSSYRLGDGWVEFLEPDGAGPLADEIARRGPHLFAGGVATDDLDALVERLPGAGIEPVVQGDQVHLHPSLCGDTGLRVVVSQDAPSEPVGRIDRYYEISDMVPDCRAEADRYAALFDLDRERFHTIDNNEYGYLGVLTFVGPEGLDRFEIMTPNNPEKTMGRFYARSGESLYMCFSESAQLDELIEIVRDHDYRVTLDSHGSGTDINTMYIHPAVLGGMMLGVSARSAAWAWSGQPERVEDAP